MSAKKILVLLCLFVAFKASSQTPIVLKGDSLILPNGAKFWLGEEVTLGTGSNPDKSFAFVYTPPIFHMTKRKPVMSIYAGRKGLIKKFQREGAYKGSYSYNVLVLDMGNTLNYWCDVQGAVDNDELAFTTGNNSLNTKEARLAHLKKLLDSGDITAEDYATLRAKILNEKGPADKGATIKKNDNKPVVY